MEDERNTATVPHPAAQAARSLSPLCFEPWSCPRARAGSFPATLRPTSPRRCCSPACWKTAIAADLRLALRRPFPKRTLAAWLERHGGRQLSTRSRAFWEVVLGSAGPIRRTLRNDLWPALTLAHPEALAPRAQELLGRLAPRALGGRVLPRRLRRPGPLHRPPPGARPRPDERHEPAGQPGPPRPPRATSWTSTPAPRSRRPATATSSPGWAKAWACGSSTIPIRWPIPSRTLQGLAVASARRPRPHEAGRDHQPGHAAGLRRPLPALPRPAARRAAGARRGQVRPRAGLPPAGAQGARRPLADRGRAHAAPGLPPGMGPKSRRWLRTEVRELGRERAGLA